MTLEEIRQMEPLPGSTNEACLMNGLIFELRGDLEAAYGWYKRAADAGHAIGMRCIANLYFHKLFRPLTGPTLSQLLQRIQMPHQMASPPRPDHASALAWYREAAAHGDAESAHSVGIMMYHGLGCPKDVVGAREHIRQAASQGCEIARRALHDMFEVGMDAPPLSDETHGDLLLCFEEAARLDDACATSLYFRLSNGTPKQLSRLGYALARARYQSGGAFVNYPMPVNGQRSYAPVSIFRRWNWVTTLVVNPLAFEAEAPLLLFATDIRTPPVPVRGLERAGRVRYRSGAFGWLGEEKIADVMRLCRSAGEAPATLAPLTEEYARMGGEDAVFTEDGEKEFSVEISELRDGAITILLRYTIGGGDQGDRASEAVFLGWEPEEQQK